ncbi:MAG: hypothetical protein JSU95_09985 [Betaproteobacteria bacterium]|nr:MAG: hypothetical protein JSU95_09985 [Betaproteobacteria bacterium]
MSYEVTEMPGIFSKGDVVFGPYKATNISRSWVSSSGSGWTIGDTRYEDKETSQDYSYQFNGKGSWNGDCRAEKGHQEVDIVAGGFYVDLTCTFEPVDSEASPWRFSFKGDRSDRATGTIVLGSKTVIVGAIDRVESSPFKLAYNTGYYFHLDEQILAAVDTISKEGPVLMSNSLTQEERDRIAMVAVAFLLNQTNFDN